MSPTTSLIKFWFPVAGYSAIIFILSSIPGSTIEHLPFTVWDKLEHTVEYAGLGFLLARALQATKPMPIVLLGLIVVLGCGFYGISDEFHQSFVPGREVSALDALADTVGGVIGFILFIIIRKRVKKNGSH